MEIEESSKLFFDTIKNKSSIYAFGSEPGLSRNRRSPNYKSVVDYMQIDGHDENASNEFHPATVIDHIRQIYLEDIGIASNKQRFDQSTFKAFLNMAQFLVRVIKGLNYEESL